MLPGPPISNADLIRHFNAPAVTEQWMDTFVGTRQRHFAVDLDTGTVRYSLADMAAEAGRRALAGSGMAPASIELVVMGTASPDKLMPATVNVVADMLGINEVPSFQLQSGCAGAIQALDIAHQMLLSGRYRTALVLGAESCAKHLDLSVDSATLSPAEQVNGMLFGDGAGALVLSTLPSPAAAVIRHVFVELVGLNRPPGQVVEWSGRGDRDAAGPAVAEDYKAIEESVPVLAGEALAQLLDALGWKETDLDYLLPPQLSGRMTSRITEHLDVPQAQEISCVGDIGNTGNSLPFFQLKDVLPRMIAGDRAVAIAIESSKWIKAGFGLERA